MFLLTDRTHILLLLASRLEIGLMGIFNVQDTAMANESEALVFSLIIEISV